MDLSDLQRLVALGESVGVEFKRSTGQLERTGETLCGFLNGRGGCVLAGHPEPEFLERGNTVGVRFIPRGYVPPLKVSQELSERQREILHVLATCGALPLRRIEAALAVAPARRTVQADLAQLRFLGLVRSVGSGRGAVYELVSAQGPS